MNPEPQSAPPTYGAAPQAGPQYGAPQPGGQPYGTAPQAGPPQAGPPPYGTAPQGGQPPYGAPPVGPPMYNAQAKPPRSAKSKNALIRIGVLVGVVVLIAIGSFIYRHVSGNPDIAKAGDCMTGQSESTLKVVKCTDAKAQWDVVGKVNNQKEDDTGTMADVCTQWPTAEASFWKGDKGGTGYVLCLAPKS